MRPLVGLPPCGIPPSVAEETTCAYAHSDPTAQDSSQVWFGFNDLINRFPFLFNPSDIATGEGVQMYISKWLEEFVVDDRHVSWEAAISYTI